MLFSSLEPVSNGERLYKAKGLGIVVHLPNEKELESFELNTVEMYR